MSIKKTVVLDEKATNLKKGDEVEIDGRKGIVLSVESSRIQVPAHSLNQTVLTVSFEGTRVETFITHNGKTYPKRKHLSGGDRVRAGVSGWTSRLFNRIF